MDEPLSNRDAKLRVSTRAQIKNLQHELKTTTIYVTHDQIEAMTLADRVVVMYHGAITESGPVEQIFSQPGHPYLKALLHSVQSIFLPCSEGLLLIGFAQNGQPKTIARPSFLALKTSISPRASAAKTES